MFSPKAVLRSLATVNRTLEHIERHLANVLDLERAAYQTQRDNREKDEADYQEQRESHRHEQQALVNLYAQWRQEDIARWNTEHEKTWRLAEEAKAYGERMERVSQQFVAPEPPRDATPAPTPRRRGKATRNAAHPVETKQEVEEATPEQSEAINEMASIGQEMELSD